MKDLKTIKLDGKTYVMTEYTAYKELIKEHRELQAAEKAPDSSKFISVSRVKLNEIISLVSSLPGTNFFSTKASVSYTPEAMARRNERRAYMLANFRERFGEHTCVVCKTKYVPRIAASKYCTRRCSATGTAAARLAAIAKNKSYNL